jgi:hypothetical protein
VRRDEDFDIRVLQRLIVNDQSNNSAPSIQEYEAWEEAQRLVQKQKHLDELEEAHDMAAHVFKSPLNKYDLGKVGKDGERVIIRDYGNRTR